MQAKTFRGSLSKKAVAVVEALEGKVVPSCQNELNYSYTCFRRMI